VTEEPFHIPVLLGEVIDYLNPKEGDLEVDCTLGGGGHAQAILRKIGTKGRLLGIDQDLEAIERAKKVLAEFSNQVIFVRDNFINLKEILKNNGIEEVDGILLDLGASSYQLETPKRGFSFSEEETNLNAPLDMRMNSNQSVRAYEIINFYPEKRLRKIFFELGEESYAARVAQEITRRREGKRLETIGDLLEAIKAALPPKYRFSRIKGHWAGKVFRAIRMEVNQELVVLKEVLPQTIESLKKGGRLAIISFHSLEDRIVKQQFLDWERENLVEILTKKPVMATKEEIAQNPRADSAKLRAIMKISIDNFCN